MKHSYISGVSTLKIDAEKCTGCGRCVESVPWRRDIHNHCARIMAIGQLHGMRGLPLKTASFGALSVKNGVGCAVAMITGLMTKGGS